MFIRNVAYTFSTEIVAVGINFLVGVLLARALSVPDRGIMVMVVTFSGTAFSLASVGLPQANVYLICRKGHKTTAVLGNALVMALLNGLLAILLLSAFKETLLSTLLKGMPDRYWLPLVALIPVLLADVMFLSILRARQRFDLFNLRLLGNAVLSLVAYALVLLVFRAGLDATVGAYVVVTVSMSFFSMELVRREVGLKLKWDPQLTVKALQFGFKSYLQNLVGSLNYRIDVYLLAFLLSPSQVAIYGIAASLAQVAWYMPDSVGVVLFPRLSSAPEGDVYWITAKVCRITLAFTALVVLGLMASAWLLLPLLYGPTYKASVAPLMVLLPGILTMSLYKVLTSNFTSRNRQQVSILAASVALALNIGLDLLLIRPWGVIGAAVASTTGYAAAGSILLVFFLRESGLSWQEAVLSRPHELATYWHRITSRVQRQTVIRRKPACGDE